MRNTFVLLRSYPSSLVTYALASILIAACATTPQQDVPKILNQGTWSAKAQITNKKTGARQQVSLQIMALQPDKLRMEVSGTMGMVVASVVLNQNQVSYALYRQKKFFSGQNSDQALLPLFHVKLNPALLMNICFDRPVASKDWSCLNDKMGTLSTCTSEDSQIEISWSERSGAQKRVKIQSADFEINVAFKDFSPEIRTKGESIAALFELTPPDNFIKYKLR